MQNIALDLDDANKNFVFHDHKNDINVARFQTLLFRNECKRKPIKFINCQMVVIY